MKTIHKKIIRLQARAMARALSRIKKAVPDSEETGKSDGGCLIYRENNRRFIPGKQSALGMKESARAVLLRLVLAHPSFKDYCTNHPSNSFWAVWHYGNTYSMKEIVAEFMALKKAHKRPTVTAIDQMRRKYALEHCGLFS